jgi:hypothetical protein
MTGISEQALAAAIGDEHPTLRFRFKRLGDECLRAIRAKGADGAPDSLLWDTLRFAELGGDGRSNAGDWVCV